MSRFFYNFYIVAIFRKNFIIFGIIFLPSAKIASSLKIGKEWKMDKKIKFSDQPTKVKIIYAAVISVLCITAIVVGIVSAASKSNKTPETELKPPIGNEGNDQAPNDNDGVEDESKPPEKLTFVSPVVGEVIKSHSMDTPVFSNTLNEWRVHTGIDIAAEEGSKVYAAADGKVSAIYNDPFLGRTVELTHVGGIVSVYSNLTSSDVKVKVGDNVRSGDVIGTVGDTSLSELADESHLHFGVKVDGVSVNPLDYITEDSKKASLGITGA